MATKKDNRTLDELLAAQAELEAAIEERRAAEAGEALEQIAELVQKFGFTSEDIFPTKRTRRPSDPSKAKLYRNPKTGEEYHGRGKPPRSFAEVGKDVWQTWLVQ
jgi:DNA-binding protein H-NS